jgi:cell filamentation protein
MADENKREQIEAQLTFGRIAELRRRPVEGKFDVAHLRETHRRIFQDLPQHAPGEYRPESEMYYKGRALEQSPRSYNVHYAHRSKVDEGVEKVLSDLGGPDALRGLNAEQFSGRMAKLYGDLDHLHPFTEGNSRTLRTFTAQLAREAGHELDWNASNADAVSRDRLYIARDKEVVLREFPGLDQDQAMKTDNRLEYEAYVKVLAPFAKAPSLKTLIQESAFKAQDLAAAKSFREEDAATAVDKNPDLAGSFAKLTAIERKAEADGLTEPQRSIVIARARETLAVSIERGHRHQQPIKAEQRREQGSERDSLEP